MIKRLDELTENDVIIALVNYYVIKETDGKKLMFPVRKIVSKFELTPRTSPIPSLHPKYRKFKVVGQLT